MRRASDSSGALANETYVEGILGCVVYWMRARLGLPSRSGVRWAVGEFVVGVDTERGSHRLDDRSGVECQRDDGHRCFEQPRPWVRQGARGVDDDVVKHSGWRAIKRQGNEPPGEDPTT
jgi:hypothetical protein